MATQSTQPKNFAGGVLRFSDGTGTPVTLTGQMFEGDYSLDGVAQDLNEDVVFTSRTLVIGLGVGAPSIPQLSMSCKWGNIVGSSGTAPGTVTEFVTGKGAYAANVSTLGANRRMTVDVRWTIEGTGWGDTADETVDCEDVRFNFGITESAEANKLAFTGKVLGNIVITNSSNVVTLSQFA